MSSASRTKMPLSPLPEKAPEPPRRRPDDFVGGMIFDVEERLATSRDAISNTSDREYRHQLTMEMLTLREALAWMRKAQEVEAPITYGCRESRNLSLPAPASVVIDRIVFRKNTYTTDDPFAIARIEHHMHNSYTPLVEKIPDDYVPNFNSAGAFISWSTAADHLDLVEREVSEPNYF